VASKERGRIMYGSSRFGVKSRILATCVFKRCFSVENAEQWVLTHLLSDLYQKSSRSAPWGITLTTQDFDSLWETKIPEMDPGQILKKCLGVSTKINHFLTS
jgi:hypothetical protein